jgi:hypothetical protein
MTSILISPFLTGVLAGMVCVLGIFLGTRLLTKTDKTKSQLVISVALLVGQFFVALAILYWSPARREAPIPLGIGIALSTFVAPILMQRFFK